MYLIKEIDMVDAPLFIELCKVLDEDSSFMLLEPGERNTSLEEQQRFIENAQRNGDKNIFLAVSEGRLVGFLYINQGEFMRNKHSASLVVGVLSDFQRNGIGGALIDEAECWARRNSVSRLELKVMSHNNAAISLYKNKGFEIEGCYRNSLLVNGFFVDENAMAKVFEIVI